MEEGWALGSERTVAFALMLRKHKDARDVVPLLRRLFLAEVPHERVAAVMHLAQHVEQERVDLAIDGTLSAGVRECVK